MITLNNTSTNPVYFNQGCKNILSWDDYNKAIVDFYFQYLEANGKPDYIIGVGEDSFIMGNALSRLFGKSVGYIMTDADGSLAEHISIIKQPILEGEEQGAELQTKPLRGKVLVVSLTPFADISKVLEKLDTPTIAEVKTGVLFDMKREDLFVPDQIFENIDLSHITPEDVKHLTDQEINRIAKNLFHEISLNPTKKIIVKELRVPEEDFSIVEEQPNSSVLNVTYDEYGVMTIEKALKILQKGEKPDLVVGLARGGLYSAKGVAKLLNVPMAVYHTSSYKQSGECKQSELLLGEHMSIACPYSADMKVWVADDLVDSGRTLIKTIEALVFKKIMTAVFFKKPNTVIHPDIHIKTADGRWIVLPDELFERLNLDKIDAGDLAKMLGTSKSISCLTGEVFRLLPENPTENISVEALKDIRIK